MVALTVAVEVADRDPDRVEAARRGIGGDEGPGEDVEVLRRVVLDACADDRDVGDAVGIDIDTVRDTGEVEAEPCTVARPRHDGEAVGGRRVEAAAEADDRNVAGVDDAQGKDVEVELGEAEGEGAVGDRRALGNARRAGDVHGGAGDAAIAGGDEARRREAEILRRRRCGVDRGEGDEQGQEDAGKRRAAAARRQAHLQSSLRNARRGRR